MKITKRQLRRIIKEEKARILHEQMNPDIAALSRNIPRQAEAIVEKMGHDVWTALGVSDPHASVAKMKTNFPWVNADEVYAFFAATRKGLQETWR